MSSLFMPAITSALQFADRSYSAVFHVNIISSVYLWGIATLKYFPCCDCVLTPSQLPTFAHSWEFEVSFVVSFQLCYF